MYASRTVVRLGAGAFLVVAMAIALIFVGDDAPRADATEMCDPVTTSDFDDTQPGGEATSTTTPPGSSTTTASTSTTAPATTTTTDAESTTTILTEETTTTVEACVPFVYPMTYPLATRGRVISSLGDERDEGQRLHKGTDIAAPHLTPVLAVSDGKVAIIRNESGSEDCCWVALRHDDGWASWYIHLNNDTLDTDDGLGAGVRADLEVGDAVDAGDVIGWIGDSGNAETTNSEHLHFELRNSRDEPVDAEESLRIAGTGVPRATGSNHYLDHPEDPYRRVAGTLASYGVLWSCDGETLTSCPDELAETTQLTTVVATLFGLDVPALDGSFGIEAVHGDDSPHDFIVKKLMGCTTADGCSPTGLTRAELARLAAGALRHQMGSGHAFEQDGAAELVLPDQATAAAFLRFSGSLGACEIPLNAHQLLQRDESIYLLLSWIGLMDVDACPPTELPAR